MNKWSEEGLPQDVFDLILNLCSFLDSVRVGFVSKSWQSVSKLNMIRRPQLPGLMMRSNNRCVFRCVFSLSNSFYKMPYKMPQILEKSFCGSFINSGGWLMTIDCDMKVQLFHPWRRTHLNLPRFSISNVSKPTIIKAAMSDDAAVVAVIALIDSSQIVAFCRIREDRIWTLIAVTPRALPHPLDQRYEDIIYHKGHFYMVDRVGGIGVLNINTTTLTRTRKAERISRRGKRPLPPLFMRSMPSGTILFDKGRFYTVRSDGAIGGVINLYGETQMGGVNSISRKAARLLNTESYLQRNYLVPDLATESLFIVQRVAEAGCGLDDGRETEYILATYDFEVFELQEGEGKSVEVESLGDRVMFLGPNSSMLVMASQFSGLKGNCICFTDDWAPEYKLPSANADMGIFNMEDRTIRPLDPSIPHPSSLPPIWIAPPPPEE